jgi:hypothetical protein
LVLGAGVVLHLALTQEGFGPPEGLVLAMDGVAGAVASIQEAGELEQVLNQGTSIVFAPLLFGVSSHRAGEPGVELAQGIHGGAFEML